MFKLRSQKEKNEAAEVRERQVQKKQSDGHKCQNSQQLPQSSVNIRHIKLLNARLTETSPGFPRRRHNQAAVATCHHQVSQSSLDIDTKGLQSLQLSIEGASGSLTVTLPLAYSQYTKGKFDSRLIDHPSASQYEVDVFTNISNLFWKPGLTFHPYKFGDCLVGFGSLWPTEEDLDGLLTDLCETTLRRSVLDLARLVMYCGPPRALRALLGLNIIGEYHCIMRRPDSFACDIFTERYQNVIGRTQMHFGTQHAVHICCPHVHFYMF